MVWADHAFLFHRTSPAEGELVFSEIHYHPPTPRPANSQDSTFRSSDFEFVELLNNSEKALNLSGLAVNGEVSFFLDGTAQILEPANAS